jgi:hypothetical protein
MSSQSGYAEAPPESESDLPQNQESAIRILANTVHRLNEAVARVVDAGISVELIRTARYHNASGNWGDQLTPLIRQKN